jgi:hypothetical protein
MAVIAPRELRTDDVLNYEREEGIGLCRRE